MRPVNCGLRSKHAATSTRRVLDRATEYDRREQRIEGPTQNTPDRYPQKELGEPICRGPAPRELAMADHRDHEEGQQVEKGEDPEGSDRSEGHGHGEREHENRQQPVHALMRDARPPSEGEDERQQVDRERHHPQQRHGRHVGGEIGRDSQHQTRGNEREQDPASPPQRGNTLYLPRPGRHNRGRFYRRVSHGRCAGTPHDGGATDEEPGEQHVAEESTGGSDRPGGDSGSMSVGYASSAGDCPVRRRIEKVRVAGQG